MRTFAGVLGSVGAFGFVLLTSLSHAAAYESGDLMCQAGDEFPDDGINFMCMTHQRVVLATGFVQGPVDAADFTLRVYTDKGGDRCHGTVNCNIEFDTASFFDETPGVNEYEISYPSSVSMFCYCR